jgi:hypothetical protein
MKSIFNKVTLLLVSLITIINFSSCNSNAEKRVEIAKIIESRDAKDLLNDLYIGSDGDIEALARILGVTPSSISRIRTGATKATEDFEERIKDVSIYYSLNGQSFSKLRAAIDSEWAWYDSVLHWPSHNPWAFWTINIILLLLLAFIALIAIWPILIEMLLFLIVWLCSLIFSPTPMEDKYADSINPIIEQIL